MIVCHCQGISDRSICRAVAAGATTRREVTRACGAGGRCGGCHPAIEELIAEHSAAPYLGGPSKTESAQDGSTAR